MTVCAEAEVLFPALSAGIALEVEWAYVTISVSRPSSALYSTLSMHVTSSADDDTYPNSYRYRLNGGDWESWDDFSPVGAGGWVRTRIAVPDAPVGTIDIQFLDDDSNVWDASLGFNFTAGVLVRDPVVSRVLVKRSARPEVAIANKRARRVP
jgi:hypothetical protein